jgi:formylglycine-generating enzyme required for sulfatase activity
MERVMKRGAMALGAMAAVLFGVALIAGGAGGRATALVKLKTFTNSAGMKFVLLPAGSFLMGSPPGVGAADEHPQHRVILTRPFYMQTTEVTQGQWRAVMGEGSYNKFDGNDRLPVEGVNWVMAQQFITALNKREKTAKYRLPTEAEWEYACRAGTTTPFYTGATISTNQANYDGRTIYGPGKKGVFRRKTLPVGSFPPNAWGLYDMHGNVWEWCSDYYDENYYAHSPQKDPQGPKKGDWRIIRGGSWDFEVESLRSARRYGIYGFGRPSHNIGFRVVRDQ